LIKPQYSPIKAQKTKASHGANIFAKGFMPKVALNVFGVLVVTSLVLVSIIKTVHEKVPGGSALSFRATTPFDPPLLSISSVAKPIVERFDSRISPAGTRMLTGIVKNPTNRQFRYVEVEFNLYNKSGSQVGTTIATMNNLEPGGVWTFEAPISQTDVMEAQLKNVTSF
jgi:hypothetical protein